MTSHCPPTDTQSRSPSKIQCKRRIGMDDDTQKLDNTQKGPCKRNKRTSKKRGYALMSKLGNQKRWSQEVAPSNTNEPITESEEEVDDDSGESNGTQYIPTPIKRLKTSTTQVCLKHALYIKTYKVYFVKWNTHDCSR